MRQHETPGPVSDVRHVVAVDLGGTNLRVALFTPGGEELLRRRLPTPPDRPEALTETIEEIAAAAPIPVAGVAIALAGSVSYAEGRALMMPNLPAWTEYLSITTLSARLGVPVVLMNDVDAAALGEHRFGAGRGVEDLVALAIGTGVGAGVVLGGRLVHARRSLAEIGWLPIAPGAAVSIEQVAAGPALAARAGLPAPEAVLRALAGEPAAVAAVAESAEAIAHAATALVLCFAPQRLVIGGGFGLGAWELVLPTVRQRLEALRWLGFEPDVVPAALRDDSGLRGALAFWQDLHAPD